MEQLRWCPNKVPIRKKERLVLLDARLVSMIQNWQEYAETLLRLDLKVRMIPLWLYLYLKLQSLPQFMSCPNLVVLLLTGHRFLLNRQKRGTLNQSLIYRGKLEFFRPKGRKKKKMHNTDASRFLK